MRDGYIKLHRRLMDNVVASNLNYLGLWCYLLLLVNRFDNDMIVDNKVVKIKSGQTLTSKRKLSEKFGIAISTVKYMLDLLEAEQMIEQSSTSRYTVITVLNYDKYQVTEQPIEHCENTEKTLRKTIKKDKKEKNNNIRFKKPTILEIKKYCIERKNKINAEKFYNYYESNGWKVGRNSMKDWKAAVRTWENNTKDKNKTIAIKQKETYSDDYAARKTEEWERYKKLKEEKLKIKKI